jgi:hypothetical protein
MPINPSQANLGLNLNQTLRQIPEGQYTFAVNAILSGFDGQKYTLQNDQGNEICTSHPERFQVIARKNIIEKGIILLMLTDPETGESEIGTIQNCQYQALINDECLNFSVDYPIHKIEYKLNGDEVEVYFTDFFNNRRFLNLSKLPFKKIENDCGIPTETTEIDCNRLNVQPDFRIPIITVESVNSDGLVKAGAYQFAIQYANANTEPYTGWYAITDPLSLFDPNKITQDFNYDVNKSVKLDISDIDVTGFYDYFNIAVIKTINNITSADLVGTYQITSNRKSLVYTGQKTKDLSIDEIFQRYPIYKKADDLTAIQDILVWSKLTAQERISYQRIANDIKIWWQTWRVPAEKAYANELNQVYLKGYMRDEVVPLEAVFELTNGHITDGFPIPGRLPTSSDLEMILNDDSLVDSPSKCETAPQPKPKWQVYNTASVTDYEQIYKDFTSVPSTTCSDCPPTIDLSSPECYTGPYQYGEMAYWESEETYPCDEEIWGSNAGKKIRHPKFPDSLISHIHDNNGFIYPIGVRVDVEQIKELITNSSLTQEQKDSIAAIRIIRGNRANNKSIIAKGIIHNVGKYTRDGNTYYFPNYIANDVGDDSFLSSTQTDDDSGRNEGTRLRAFDEVDSKQRFTFHSPDTSFYQPSLGNVLKLETAEYGQSKGHFVQVQDHAKYKFLSTGSYMTALALGALVGVASAEIGLSTKVFDGTAAFTAFQTFLSIVEKLVPSLNFAYQFNSVSNYTNYKAIPNSGNKQRFLDLSLYLSPGMHSVGDTYTVNNFQRESSVYLKTYKALPFTHSLAGVPEDRSKYVNSDVGCSNEVTNVDVSSYYASIKRNLPNQWGQIGSYETVDTGWRYNLSKPTSVYTRYQSVFGGDVFINRFAYKSKLPFFIDNRVGLKFADGSDIAYNELGNVAYPIFWMSTDAKQDIGGSAIFVDFFKTLFGVKVNNFDCTSQKFFYQKGKFYLFAYGVPYFYTESEVNVDLRQAYNGSEGDFYPRVGSDIPDEWLQEKNTTIQQDNTYFYNKSFSKQNKETFFTHYPENYNSNEENLTHSAVYSEKQDSALRNNWLIYKPISRFDFPQKYGQLIGIEAIENRQLLVRFENSSKIYNALLTAPTSAADVYLGQTLFSKQAPPIDFAETDLGFNGSQHKFFLKTEFGNVSVDAKRGQIFLMGASQKGISIKEMTDERVSDFFIQNLNFKIKESFPEINIDNAFKDIGLTGVFDNRYDRVIITKRDYEPIVTGITYTNGKFFLGEEEISLDDNQYFANRSFTASYNLNPLINAWVSFHTFTPNYYIGSNNIFYTNSENGIWRHNTSNKFHNYYGNIEEYTIEYPQKYKYNDEILQSIKDYTQVLRYTDNQTFIQTNDVYFDEGILSNNQQCSGVLKFVPKPKNNIKLYNSYPIYNTDSKEVLFTKSDDFYNFNTFWSMVRDVNEPIFMKSNDSIHKVLNQSNMDYSKRARRKEPLRSKDLKIRLTLNSRDDHRFISQFLVTQTIESYK